ncbi:MAG: M20/M25/M40 family metallo-hydrolase [Firmicutes bacterium]|nr:M20/M25/M40 family metallo-hydrolase [Bacillota bacterium]
MENIKTWLKCLIDFNTTCDKGNEYDCAEFIRKTLKEYNIDTTIWTVSQNRSSTASFIEGRRRETIVLHAHIDTAEYGDGWKFPPEKALFKKGCVCGRGALDCKSQLAVWMKILTDVKKMAVKPEYSLMLLATADEENGGKHGLEWLVRNTEILKNAVLVIGEGGGFPFPFDDKVFYTFQTGEREDFEFQNDENEDPILAIDEGIKKGYYSHDVKEYFLRQNTLFKRKLDVLPLYAGMSKNFMHMENSVVYHKYGTLFQNALQEHCPNGQIMPVITPGYSDNRYFRRMGIATIGFFPLDIGNALSGIHGKNEYISEKSLFLAYSVIKKIILKLLLTFEENSINI